MTRARTLRHNPDRVRTMPATVQDVVRGFCRSFAHRMYGTDLPRARAPITLTDPTLGEAATLYGDRRVLVVQDGWADPSTPIRVRLEPPLSRRGTRRDGTATVFQVRVEGEGANLEAATQMVVQDLQDRGYGVLVGSHPVW